MSVTWMTGCWESAVWVGSTAGARPLRWMGSVMGFTLGRLTWRQIGDIPALPPLGTGGRVGCSLYVARTRLLLPRHVVRPGCHVTSYGQAATSRRTARLPR